MKTIPLSLLETDPTGTLNECADSGEPYVVELPDHRLLSIQTLEPDADDDLVNQLLQSNPKFRDLVARSKVSPRKPFGSQ